MKQPIRLLCLLTLLPTADIAAHPGADAAVAYFSEQIREQPGEQSLYIQRGMVYSNDGQYPQALQDFRQAARLGEQILISFDLGLLYYRMGEFANARRYFDEFLQRFPDHAACLEYRARMLRDQGSYVESVADFRRVFALRENPNPGDYISVARMLQSAGAAGIEAALTILDEGNAKLGLTPQLQRFAIQLEVLRQRNELAIARMQVLEPMLGEGPEWKVDMAELLLKNGQPEPALELLNAAALQLESLRITPARLETRQRVDNLRVAAAKV